MARTLLLLALLMAPGALLAKQAELPLRASDSFQNQQQKVRADLQAGEVYSEISPADRALVVEALDRMSAAIGDGNAEGLSQEKRVQVFNDQALVNSFLTRRVQIAALSAVVRKPLGEHVFVTVRDRGPARTHAAGCAASYGCHAWGEKRPGRQLTLGAPGRETLARVWPDVRS